VRGLDETPLGHTYVDVMVVVSPSLDIVDNVSLDHFSIFHVFPHVHYLPLPPSVVIHTC